MDNNIQVEQIKDQKADNNNAALEANENKSIAQAETVEEIQENKDISSKTGLNELIEQAEHAESATAISEDTAEQPATTPIVSNVHLMQDEIKNPIEQHTRTLDKRDVATKTDLKDLAEQIEPAKTATPISEETIEQPITPIVSNIHFIQDVEKNLIEQHEGTLDIKDVSSKTDIEEIVEQAKPAEKTAQITEETAGQPTTTPITSNIHSIHDEVKNLIEQHARTFGMNDVTVDVSPGSNLGDNFMGFIGKLTINGTYENNTKKTFHWIIKSAPNIELYRTMLKVEDLYAREAYVYEEIFPVFKQFQLEKRVLKPFNEHPPLIFTHMEYMLESIVMEDMKSIGYAMTNRQEPLGLNYAKLIMKTYGKLHAISYALKDQKPELFEKLASNTEDVFTAMAKDDATTDDNMQTPLMESALEALDPVKDAKVIVKFKKFAENVMDLVKAAVRRTNQYSVIGHGDCWVNNILWKYEEPSKPNVPTKVCLLDWQICRYGSPACDLSYFLFTCTTKEFRDKHFHDMIRLYYYTMCGHVIDLGGDPEKFLPYEALQQELKASSVAGIYMSIFVLYVITRETSEMPEWREGNINADEVGKKWTTQSANIDKYRDRVRGVIVDAYEMGYLNCID